MTTLRNSVYLMVVAVSVVTAACQPAESPEQRVSRDIDQAARQLADQFGKDVDDKGAARNRSSLTASSR